MSSDYPNSRNGPGADLSTPEASKHFLWLWVGANTLGFAIATSLTLFVQASTDNLKGLYVAGLIVGAIVGPLQACVIKRQVPHLKRWQWILASIVGSYLGAWVGLLVWGLGLWLAMLVAQLLGHSSAFPGNIVFTLLTVSVYGAVIGGVVSSAQLLSLRSHTQKLRQWWMANVLGRTLGWVSGGIVGWLIAETTDLFVENLFVVWGVLFGAVGGAIYASVTAKALLKLKSIKSVS